MPTTTRTAALLWDESHLWGLLLLRALHALKVPTFLLKAEHIRSGALRTLNPGTLFVPGGWARLKSLALEATGLREIRDFVRGGGNYVGLCGGAGLALASEQGTKFLELCSWSRKPARERLPNFSGHLRCIVRADSPAHEEYLPVWWPSQFAPDSSAPLDVLASYAGPGPDFWSADLDWSAVAPGEIRQWEALYGINLDPGRLRGEPCIVRGRHGAGTFILSYAHLETPDSPQANALLARLLEVPEPAAVPSWSLKEEAPLWDDPKLAEMQAALSGLVRFGQSHFLLCWRTPWLLGWRRGVPGSPINFLLALTWQARHATAAPQARAYWARHGTECLRRCLDFCRQTREYLLMERRILATAPSSPETSASPGLQCNKLALFGKFPGYGGVYGEILGTLDCLLWLQFSAPGDGTGRL